MNVRKGALLRHTGTVKPVKSLVTAINLLKKDGLEYLVLEDANGTQWKAQSPFPDFEFLEQGEGRDFGALRMPVGELTNEELFA